MISACMIVQDEEDCIERALNSINDYVDEIIVVDGGSIDRTRELVLRYPKAKLFDIPFEKNFALQYNNAIERASGDWILTLDADEYYNDYVGQNLLRLTQGDFDVYDFGDKTFIDGCLVNLFELYYHPRFFRNYCRFEGKLHSRLVNGKRGTRVNLDIMHYKTSKQQQDSNMLYWDMGQEPPPPWQKVDGKWIKVE
jgi:hypothetical protein